MHLTILDHILFALIAFVMPVLAVFRVRPQVAQIPTNSKVKIRLYWLNSMVLWGGAVVAILVWWFSGRDWPLMGWQGVRPDYFPEWLIAVAVIALFYMFDTFLSWNRLEHHASAALLPANWREFLHFGTVVSISAGVCEEIVFRGFLVTYIVVLLDGSPYAGAVAVIGSALIFAVLHAYQGWVATVKIGLLTVLFGMIFLMTSSLIPVIIVHFLIDFLGGLVATVANRLDASGPQN